MTQMFWCILNPFYFLIGKKRYTPDCFIQTVDGERLVIEIKPQGVMDGKAQLALQCFFEQHHMLFKVISNESILERKIDAEKVTPYCVVNS